jgi:hypothetical protein
MNKRDIYHMPAVNIDPWNRTLCGVLEEMRKCYETRNFAPLLGLIEEAQTYGNRMEAKLSDTHRYEQLKERHKKLKAEVESMNIQLDRDPNAGHSRFE